MSPSNTAVNGTVWTLTERISVQLAQFAIGVILARLLTPGDYGMVGLLAVFLGISQLCLDCGFGNALIRKKERTAADYSTVFYFNMAVSLVMYALLFIASPWIARFYEIPELTDITRIISLSILINATSLVQTAKFTAELRFKQQAIASIVAVLGSGILGIVLAYNGFGVWALVVQNLCMAFLRSLSLWIMSDWHPQLIFSVNSFKEMFSYGSKLLAGGFIHTIYTNLYTITIGKAFSATDAGYYNRANTYGIIPNDIFYQVSSKVFFPILSQKQDNDADLLLSYGKAVRVSMCVYVPLMLGMAALSAPLLEALVGPKWLPASPLLTVLCIGYAFAPMSTLNLNLLYVKGRSDLTLKLDIIKKSLGIAILFAMLPFGIIWMCVGKAGYELIAFSLNTFYTRKLLGYGFWKQVRDIAPTLVKAALMFVAILAVTSVLNVNVWAELALGTIAGFAVYLILSVLVRDDAFMELKKVLFEKKTSDA